MEFMDELDTLQSGSDTTTADVAPAPTQHDDLNSASNAIAALMKSEPNSDPNAEPQKELTAPAQADKAVEPTLSEEEKQSGYMRQADYTRKTMEIAEQRRVIEAERQQVQYERANYAQQLQGMMYALAQERPPNWEELLQTDPTAYLQERHKWEQKANAFQRAQHELQNLQVTQQREQAAQIQNVLASEQDRLFQQLPDWKDEKKRDAEQKSIRDTLIKHGFAANELDNLIDHRQVIIARKAMLYDQMQANMQKAKEVAAKLPPVRNIASGSPSAGGQPINQSAMQRLKQSRGRDMDAAASAIRSLLG